MTAYKKREDLPLESTDFRCHDNLGEDRGELLYKVAYIFIVDPLEKSSIFCLSVLYKGIWDFFLN